MTSPKKQLLVAGFSFALLMITAKPKPTDPTQPGEITQEGLQLNGPALNDQTIGTQTNLRELSTDTIYVEMPGSAKGHLSLEGTQLYLQLPEYP